MLHRIAVLVLCAALLASGLTLGLPDQTLADGTPGGPGEDPPPRPPRLIGGANSTFVSPWSFLYLQVCLMTL